MVKGKILKLKKFIDLNEAAERLTLSLEEPINALDILELGLQKELTLSIRFPYTHKVIARKVTETTSLYVDYLKEVCEVDFSIKMNAPYKEKTEEYERYEEEYLEKEFSRYLLGLSNSESLVPDEYKTYDFFINKVQKTDYRYSTELVYLEKNIYELPMIGAEYIDVITLMDKANGRPINELYNLDGVFLRDSDGSLYNVMERFNQTFLDSLDNDLDVDKKYDYLDPSCYFPAPGLPDGCEVGIAPKDLLEFENKISEEDDIPNERILYLVGYILGEVTTKAKKWTQGDLASVIAEKNIANLGERMINGIFSKANKLCKIK
ncbi:hypothetical protein ACI49Z_000115 [Cronobacter turicensis]